MALIDIDLKSGVDEATKDLLNKVLPAVISAVMNELLPKLGEVLRSAVDELDGLQITVTRRPPMPTSIGRGPLDPQ